MKTTLSVLVVISLAGCTDYGTVSGLVRAIDGNDECHDEDGDEVYFNVQAFGPEEFFQIEFECTEPRFELSVPVGRYDIHVQAYQRVFFGDLEREVIIRDVDVGTNAVVDLGTFELDVNDDNEPRRRLSATSPESSSL